MIVGRSSVFVAHELVWTLRETTFLILAASLGNRVALLLAQELGIGGELA